MLPVYDDYQTRRKDEVKVQRRTDNTPSHISDPVRWLRLQETMHVKGSIRRYEQNPYLPAS